MMVKKYQNLVGQNDMLLNDLNWSGDELFNFSYLHLEQKASLAPFALCSLHLVSLRK